MFKGYRNYLLYKDKTVNNTITHHPEVSKCSKCRKLNPVVNPSNKGSIKPDVQICLYCGNPFYITK